MKNKIYDYVVFMGRFQPFHIAHYNTVKEALQLGNEVIILIGSANTSRTPKNPWTWIERKSMIQNCFTTEEQSRIHFSGIEDRLYNMNLWLQFVQRAVHHIAGDAKDIALIGHHKDSSSFYLDSFPQWKQIEFPNFAKMNATDIRNSYFHPYESGSDIQEKVPPEILDSMIDWVKTDDYRLMLEEMTFLHTHHEKWKCAPYPPTFNAGDAVCFHSGHVLLIKRRNTPGKGLWALCGGYIDPEDDTELDGAIRELIEETRLKGPTKTQLKEKIFAAKTFGHKDRSLRGRIFSHAFGFNLGSGGPLPKVKGQDDAIKAKWFTFDEVADMREFLFEDHADIIDYFKGKLD